MSKTETIRPGWLKISDSFGETKSKTNRMQHRTGKNAKYYILTKGKEKHKCNNQKEIVAVTGATKKTVMNRCTSGQRIKGWLVERIFEDE